jgi:hypothetical protein
VGERHEKIPAIAHDSLLALHWLALVQAKNLLAPGGVMLSSMGGRVPLVAMLEMARSAGYCAQVLTYTWKIQSEPEEVIGGYKKNQEDGHRLVSATNKPMLLAYLILLSSSTSTQLAFWKILLQTFHLR